MNLTEWREKEIWNDGYATGYSKGAGDGMKAITVLDELLQILWDKHAVIDEAQLARITKMIEGVDDETTE